MPLLSKARAALMDVSPEVIAALIDIASWPPLEGEKHGARVEIPWHLIVIARAQLDLAGYGEIWRENNVECKQRRQHRTEVRA